MRLASDANALEAQANNAAEWQFRQVGLFPRVTPRSARQVGEVLGSEAEPEIAVCIWMLVSLSADRRDVMSVALSKRWLRGLSRGRYDALPIMGVAGYLDRTIVEIGPGTGMNFRYYPLAACGGWH